MIASLKSPHTIATAILIAVAVVVAPLLANTNQVLLTLFIVALCFAVVASNWDLLFGYAGIWSFGQLAFFTIGAYSSALLTKGGFLPWTAALIGVCISSLIALALSSIVLRLRAIYFVLATIGLQEVVRGLIITIHPAMVFGIPPLQVGGFSFASYGGIPYCYSFLALLLLSIMAFKLFTLSRIGLATVALRDAELRAISLGVEPVKVRLAPFLISVIFTSLAGSLYAHYTGSISQAIIGFDVFLTYLAILAFGGIGTFYGPIMASFLWVFLDFFLRLYVAPLRLILMGGVIIASLLFLERGIIELPEKVISYLQAPLMKRSLHGAGK